MHTTQSELKNSEWDSTLRKGYDEEASRYDAKRYVSAEGRSFSRMEMRVLRDWLTPSAGPRVLDVPAGTARLSIGLAESGARVVAGDISFNMLRMGVSKVGETRHVPVTFAQVNVASLPFPDETFDAVISFKFFHLIPNDVKPALIREMARVLRPGGKLIAEFNSPYYGGVMAFFRYYFRKKHPGGMRMKCLFPDQIASLFQGLDVVVQQGVKIPFGGALSLVLGESAVESLSLMLGRVPAIRYLCYAIMIEARKPTRSA
jgi:ubiquinone/menaquinone biosynthesis C-methylase UbiE